jgi:biopolymer transport protein ExbB/TolQ
VEIIILITIVIVILIIRWIIILINKAEQYELYKPKFDKLSEFEKQLQSKSAEFERNRLNFNSEKAKWEEYKKKETLEWNNTKQKEKDELRQIAKEKTIGFPWLANAYADYYYINDIKTAHYLETKIHPAKSTAEKIRKISH